MWIVQYALSRRYTIAVIALMLLIFGGLSARHMPTDILPRIDIPSVKVLWTYSGLPAAEMAAKITSLSEISILNNVDDLKQVGSQTINGIGIIRVDLQPGAPIDRALTQITAVSQTMLRRMPAGTAPPFIVRNNVSSTPVLQLVLSSDSMTEAQLYDYARLQLRSQIQSIPGILMTLPYGGAARQVMIDLNPVALQTYNLTASQVTNAIEHGAPTLPSGSLREGAQELQVTVQASPVDVKGFMSLPIKSNGTNVIYVRDVASVRDGAALQTSIARMDGASAVSVSLIKLGGASAVNIVRAVRARLPEVIASAPAGMRIEAVFDQSIFVNNAIQSVVNEGVLVGVLVALVVLMFIGSWRSSLIVLANIPLALLASTLALHLLGNTLNIMTLGGLALAIGILVDNAVVDVENTNRHVAMGKAVPTAILDSAKEVVFPEFVSTLCICIVLTPILLLTGLSSWVFAPLALAVIFAMLASFMLSRTLIPVLCSLMLPKDLEARASPKGRMAPLLLAANHRVEQVIDHIRDRQSRLLNSLHQNGTKLLISLALLLGLGVLAATSLGHEYFPQIDAGQLRLQVRFPAGLRIEETAQRLAAVQREIRKIIPQDELQTLYEQIGIPDPINLGFVDSAVVGPFEAEVMIQLRAHHAPSAGYLDEIRQHIASKFPDIVMFDRPADATSRTLAGSALGAFEVKITGRDTQGNLKIARAIQSRLRTVPGATDVALQQVLDLPEYYIQIDRTRAAQLGISSEDASRAILSVLGSASTVSPIYWVDQATTLAYVVQVQALPNDLQNIDTLLNIPVRTYTNGEQVLLRTIASVARRTVPATIDKTMLAPTLNVIANIHQTDLGTVLHALTSVINTLSPQLKPGNHIEIGGQAQAMQSAYTELTNGLALAALLVFLLLVVNFQSWTYPLVAMCGLPFALTGSAISLWVTHTPLSVPALMGAMMVIGVSTANSVLVTSFARNLIITGHDPELAAFEAASVRLRPVLMTACAMLLGIIPMALGLGDGAEQNAPLGRAVIGGLLLGTPATLLIVPAILAASGRRRKARHLSSLTAERLS